MLYPAGTVTATRGADGGPLLEPAATRISFGGVTSPPVATVQATTPPPSLSGAAARSAAAPAKFSRVRRGEAAGGGGLRDPHPPLGRDRGEQLSVGQRLEAPVGDSGEPADERRRAAESGPSSRRGDDADHGAACPAAADSSRSAARAPGPQTRFRGRRARPRSAAGRWPHRTASGSPRTPLRPMGRPRPGRRTRSPPRRRRRTRSAPARCRGSAERSAGPASPSRRRRSARSRPRAPPRRGLQLRAAPHAPAAMIDP